MTHLSKERIDEIFESSKNQEEALISIYRMAFPDWDRIEKIHGWPAVSKETWKYICRKFMELDAKYHPDVMAGGCWMNSGFSSRDDLKKDWWIYQGSCTVEYSNA